MTAETSLTIFVGLTALALLTQAAILVGVYLRLRQVDEDTRALRRALNEQSGPILSNLADITLTVRENGRLIADDLTALSGDARRQMEKFDRLTDEMADRLRMQILRLDELMTLTLDNLERAGATVKETVGGPVREAAAVIQGVKAAIDLINSRRRPRSGARPADEQLFI